MIVRSWMIVTLIAALAAGCAGRSANEISRNIQLTAADADTEDSEWDDFFDDDEETAVVRVLDPLRPWNIAMFHLNDKLYFWVLKPVATGYKAVVPTPVRTGLSNFFHNLTTPVRLANCILQGKGESAANELGRFLVNTTVGILGFRDAAKNDPRLVQPDEEDLGQTLGFMGIGDGFYIMLPILGPSTLRDTLADFGDRILSPFSYINSPELSTTVYGLRVVNEASFKIGDYEALKDAALDPYEALRDAYIQYRHKKILK